MMSLSNPNMANTKRQSGVAILAITVVLLLVATIGTLVIGRVGLEEQKLAGTDVRSKEVYAAAVGGLEHGVSWFKSKPLDADGNNIANFTLLDFSGGSAALASVTGAELPEDVQLQADTYTRNIQYELLSNDPVVVRVMSTSSATNDSHVEKTVSVDLILGDGGGPFPGGGSEFNGPPIVVEECTGNNTGTPKVAVYDANYASGGAAPAGIVTTNGTANCVIPGHISQYVCEPSGCEERQLHRETEVDPPQIGEANPSGTLANTLFGGQDIDQLAANSPQRIKVFETDGQFDDYEREVDKVGGAPGRPVVLYFKSGVCPKLNGGWVVYGIVYVATTDPDCDLNGWGNTTIHGTLAKAGDLNKMTANTEIYNTGLDFSVTVGDGGNSIVEGLSTKVSVVPGSWKDF